MRATPTAQRRLALAAKRTGSKGANPFNAALDVTVDSSVACRNVR